MTGTALDHRKSRSGRWYSERTYKCPSKPVGCSHTSINAEFLEGLVVSAALERLERRSQMRPTIDPPLDAPERLIAAYESHADSLRTLAIDYYVHHRVTREEWEAARAGLEHQLGAARRRFDPRWRPTAIRKPKSVTRFRADWDSLDLGHRRDILASEIESVRVDPAQAGAAGVFDPGRIHVTWWDADSTLSIGDWPLTHNVTVDAWDRGRWMSTREAAEVLGLSVLSVLSLAHCGELPAVKVARLYRYRREDVERYAARFEGTVTTEQAATQLGLDREFISDCAHKGLLPASKRSGRYYLQPDDVRVFGERFRSACSDLLTVPEAASLMKVSRDTVRNRIYRGELQAIRCEGTYRLMKDEVIRQCGQEESQSSHRPT